MFAMMECVVRALPASSARGEIEIERGQVVGRSIDPSNLDGREGTTILGTKRRRSRGLTGVRPWVSH